MNTLKFSVVLCTLLLGGGSMLFGQSIKFNIKPEKEPTEKTGMIIRYCTASEYKKAEQEKRKVKWDSIGTLQKPIPFAKEYNLEIEEAKLEQETYAFSVRLVNDKN